MAKDPVCGMEGTINKHGQSFCSEHCAKKYAQGQKNSAPWYKQKFWIVLFITCFVLVSSLFIPLLDSFRKAFVEYLALMWWAILLGLLLGGIIDRFVPRSYITTYLSKANKKTIFSAALLGFIMSACSHGILALAIQLHKKGASTPAVVTFLLASPWANLPVTILLFGFFGLKALLLILSAIIIATITGFIYQILEKHNLIEQSTQSLQEKIIDVKKDIRRRWQRKSLAHDSIKKDFFAVVRGAWSLNKMVTWWILLGMIFASLARAYVPTTFFHQYMGATLLGLGVTLLVATIIEVCSEGSSPLAFEIYQQTGAFGNAFTFLMAGVATDYTEIGLIWSNIGKKAALWLPVITVPQILLVAWMFNLFL